MSNHTGSHMLNEVLKMFERESVFEQLGKPTSQKLVLSLLEIARIYDCNSGEILDDIGDRLGVCYHCQQTATQFRRGVCQRCYEQNYAPYETELDDD